MDYRYYIIPERPDTPQLTYQKRFTDLSCFNP